VIRASAATARSFVRDITDLVWIETFRVAQCFFVDIANKPTFARICGLRPRLILLTPAELRFEQWKTHASTCSQVVRRRAS
jgi:hypothetical protein